MYNPYESEAFKYCMLCGGTFKSNSLIEKECTNCGYVYFISSNPSAGALIVNDKNQILLITRKRNPFKGSLDIPAGFCDGTETLEQALVREIKEEVGLEVKNYRYFKSVVGDYDYKNVIKRYLCGIFIINVSKDDKFEAGDDANDANWYDFGTLDFDKIKFESTKEAIKEYISQLA